MKTAVNPLGVFEFDEKMKVKNFRKFNTPEEAAERISELTTDTSTQEYLSEHFRELLKQTGFDDIKANEFISLVAVTLTKKKISSMERRDKLIVQTVSALSDLDRILNSLSERLREWYGLHYPETNIPDHEKFAKVVAELGRRENFKEFESSIGIELSKEDEQMLKVYAAEVVSAYRLRKTLEEYIGNIVPREMPNLAILLGSTLAARLLACTGSIERLAKLPSSTVQMLGAEKSLFRFLKERRGSRGPPKFGVLFSHPAINTAPKELQGKIARLISAKVTVAVRMDFYSKEDHGAELKADLEKKIAEVMKK